MNHLQNRTFPLTTVEMPDNRAGDISEVKRACQPSLNDCLPLFKLNTIKTQTCNCGRAESDTVAIVWPDICNYGAEKNVICKMCSEWLRGRTFENMIWNPCVRSSFPSSRVWSLLTAGGHFQATGGWGRCDECLQNLNVKWLVTSPFWWCQITVAEVFEKAPRAGFTYNETSQKM